MVVKFKLINVNRTLPAVPDNTYNLDLCTF